MKIDVDDTEIGQATARVQAVLGVDEAFAAGLVRAVMHGAISQALETVSGSGPVPTNLTSYRAEYLQFVCLSAERILQQREAEVLLRATPASARSVITTMRATYEEALRAQFLQRMKEDAVIEPAGSDADGLRWRLTFSESDTFELARSELYRDGMREAIGAETPQRRQLMVVRDFGGRSPLSSLGLEEPPTS